MTSGTLDPMNDDRFDRELGRFLDLDARQIDGAPSRDEMVDRVARATGVSTARYPAFGSTRALRVVLALALLAALLASVLTVGSELAHRNTVVVAPTPRPTPGKLLESQVGFVPGATYWGLARTSVPFSLTMPGGPRAWLREADGNVHAGDPWAGPGVAFNTWLVTHVYVDSCHWQGAELTPTRTKAELVAALIAQKGHAISSPAEVMFGGLPATRLQIVIPTSYDGTGCDNPDLRIWPYPGGGETDVLWVFGGETVTIYVVDGKTQPTAFYTIRKVDSTPADVAALESIVASVQFYP